MDALDDGIMIDAEISKFVDASFGETSRHAELISDQLKRTTRE